MKPILNIENLLTILSEQDCLWQEKVYSQTGVIPVFCSNNKSIILFSNCGFIDIDTDTEYRNVCGVDMTEYCELKTVQDLIDYIFRMESYQEYLVDIPLGRFSKSDLFWAVYSTIINPTENHLHVDGSSYPEWILYTIHLHKECLELNMAVIDCDVADILLDFNENTDLHDILRTIASKMSIENMPKQNVYIEYIQGKPTTFENLINKLAQFKDLGWF